MQSRYVVGSELGQSAIDGKLATC